MDNRVNTSGGVMGLNIAFCHHLSLSYNGGGEKWVMQISKELVKRGHQVKVYSLPFLLEGKRKFEPKKTLSDSGVEYQEVKRQNVKADICYVTYNPLSWVNFSTSSPRIAGIHSHAYWSNPHPKYGLLPNLANVANRFTSYFELSRFDAVHAVSSVYPIRHKAVFVIPNFIDAKQYHPRQPKRSHFTIAYASRKVWQKGWDIFSQVASKADADVLLSGDIPEAEMPDLYSEAHVTLVPARVDTFGLTIVESAMCGTPVITSPLDTHRCLGLPLYYANCPEEYLSVLKCIRSMTPAAYKSLCKHLREASMKYEKDAIINNLERMFKVVYHWRNMK